MAVIRIEFVPVLGFGLERANASHLHLVFQSDTSTEEQQQDWFVVEGVFNSDSNTLGVEGGSGSLTLAAANNTGSAAELVEAIGTPSTRGSRILPFADPFSAWLDIAINGRQIDLQDLPYKAFGQSIGTATINSTSVISSLLYYAGLNINDHLPYNVGRSPGRTTLVGRPISEELSIAQDFKNLFGGKGNDTFFGTDSGENEKFFGGQDNDIFRWSAGPDIYHGGHERLDYEFDGIDTVDYTEVNEAIILLNDLAIPHKFPNYIVKTPHGDDQLFSIERLQWGDATDNLEFGPGVDIIEDGIYIDLRGSQNDEGDEFSFTNEETDIVINRATETALWIKAKSVSDSKLGIFLESAERIIAGNGDDEIYVSESIIQVDGGEGDDLIDARLATPFSKNSPGEYDVELIGGAGDDTLVSGSGITYAKGGDGSDTFILSAISQPDVPIEFVIDGADTDDKLFVPYNFLYDGEPDEYEDSPLLQLKGALGSHDEFLATNEDGGSLAFFWENNIDFLEDNNRVEGVFDFTSDITYRLEESDLIIEIFPGQSVQEDLLGDLGEVVETFTEIDLDFTRSTLIRVIDFEIGQLGIDFYDLGDSEPYIVNEVEVGDLYENWDSGVAALTNDGTFEDPLEARPDAPPSDPNGYDNPDLTNPPGGDGSNNGPTIYIGSNQDDVIVVAAEGRGDVDAEAGNDTVTGSSNNDNIDGGEGNDQLTGGAGNDTYVVDSTGDVVIEFTGEGNDTIISSVTLTTPDNVENVTLTGSALNATGSNADNVLLGNSLANMLNALGGDDYLIGEAGDDLLVGGAGSDTYAFSTGDGNDTIRDAGQTTDVDRLVFGSDLTEDDLTFIRLTDSPDDLILQVSSGERIAIEDQFLGAGFGIDEIHFESGASLDRTAIDLRANAATTFSNDPPVARDDFVIFIPEAIGIVKAEDLLFNDTDFNGDTLSIVSVQGAINGSVSLNASGDIQVTRDPNIDLAVEFSYTISDGQGGTSTAASSVYVIANEAPIAVADIAFETERDIPLVIATAALLANDVDPNMDPLTIQSVQSSTNGSVALVGENVVFTPLAGYSGAASFTYTVVDAGGLISTADVSLDVTPPPPAGETITGTAGKDTLTGTAGDDVISGGGDKDTINAGDGNDLANGDDGNDTIHGDAGDDTINGGNNGDFLFGDAGNDTINGESGQDELNGGDGADTLNGGAGDDILNGDAGIDMLFGGDGSDVIFGGSEDDVIYGEAAADNLFGDDGDDMLFGGNGDDILGGGSGLDTLHGGVGYDTLNGGDGDDMVFGESGEDTLFGDAGNDTLDGGSGYDTLNGGEGDDTLNGGSGYDTLNGGAGDDSLIGGGGYDVLNGESGSDTLDGDMGNDTLSGGEGDDILRGGTGSDALAGDDGVDQLFGDDGADTLTGGAGDDILTGGLGNDHFVFRPGFGNDTVTDFGGTTGNNDKLEFSNALFVDFADLMTAATEVGSDVRITVDTDNSVTLQNATLAQLDANDFAFVV